MCFVRWLAPSVVFADDLLIRTAATEAMAITWRAQMSIDNGVIDDDHRCLIGLVNEVDGITLGPAMPAELGVTLARLDAYTQIHFQREERLQVATAFTFQVAHHRRHNSLIRELDAMRMECLNDFTAQQLIEFHARLCDFLHQWLVDHIFKADMLMKPFVIEMKKNAQAASTLAEAVQLSAATRTADRAAAYGQVTLPSMGR
jgi:hemerythrin